MTTEYWLVAGIVAAAAGYLLRVAWKTWAGESGGCGSACGGCAPVAEAVKGRIGLPQV
jgi:hypothetical protein